MLQFFVGRFLVSIGRQVDYDEQTQEHKLGEFIFRISRVPRD